jgi:fibronectin type 3 domain-containing protein/pimeloyl-ACP methyl ester carboxylesterase
MKTTVLLFLFFAVLTSYSQNVFNPADPIVRYDKAKAYGSSQRPDTNKVGLQKWVSTPMNSVSTGSGTWDASSFKAYFINLAGNKLVFRIKFPKTYTTNTTKKFPALIFLHGAGEVGCSTNNGIYNNEKQLQLGGKLFKDAADAGKFDGFLVYPQLLSRTECWDNWYTVNSNKYTALFAMIDSLAKYARLDVDRVAMNGLSGGAFGTWRAAALFPKNIAKIIPSAGAGSTSSRDVFVHIPIWFATGGKDVDPSPATAAYNLSRMKEIGADIRYTQYPELGHAVWYNHWQEPDYFTYLNDMHKANPLIFFQRSEYCTGQAISTKLGITAGYYAYEWQKDNVTIATRTGTTNTIVNGASIVSYTGNDITVKAFGTYRVRFKRTASSAWSDWSPKPAVIKAKSGAAADAIAVSGLASKVLPALDGKTTVPLTLASGFTNYQWVRTSDNAVVASTQLYNAPVGTYKGKYNDQFGCPYDFSPTFTVVNASGSPKPAGATSLVATGNSLTSTKLTWAQGTGETNFEIYRGTTSGGPYQLINIANANATTYTDNGLDPNTTYYYVVRAINATGAAVASNQASPDGGNTAPVIGTLTDMYMKSNASATKAFTVTDNPGDVVTVTITLKPAFVTLTHVSGVNYQIAANPTASDIGWNDIEVVAKDSKGKTSTKKFAIIVTDKNTRSVFVNLGSAGKTAPAPWNNWLGTRAAGSVIGSLKDEAGATTSFSLTTVNAWSSTTNMGHITGNNNGTFPDAVLESGISDNGAAKQIKVSGLNAAKRYNLIFLGSQNEGPIATASYTSGSQTSTLDARYNTNRTANLNTLTPDGTGSIIATITRTNGSAFTYLNAVVIEEYDPSITLLPPSNLYVEALDRTSINITWSDKTNNESATNGYELQRSTSASFSTVTTINLPANTTSYKNTGLSANTRYYYRVRAKNGSTASEFSNVMSTITPATIVYVNFTATVAGGPTPWNNLNALPNVTITKTALKDQSNVSTAMALKLTKVFNGEFTAGRRTGNNSGVVPDNVLQSDYWLDNSQVSQFTLSGLNNTRRYRIGFFGSSSANGWFKDNYTATYTVNGRTVYLNSWENTTKVVYIGDLVPQSGTLLLDFSTTANAAYGFNGGLIIMEYSDAAGGTVTNAVLDSTTMIENRAQAGDAANMHVYPNPFLDVINLDFYNKSAGDRISAEVYDLTGRLVLRQDFSTLPVGRNLLQLRNIEVNKATSLCLVALKVNGKIVQTAKMVRVFKK